MKYLILGKTGLLGRALINEAKLRKLDFAAAGSSQEDLLFEYHLEELFDRENPQIIINSIAYTKVDQAEIEKEEAFLLNHIFPLNLTVLCKARGIKLVHLSTDYVFDGLKTSPYQEIDSTNPQSVYGKSKLKGEEAIINAKWQNWLILRISWLFGPHKENFLSKMFERANQGIDLKIVNDQYGNPTYTLDLAKAIFDLLDKNITGLFHYSNSESCTWYEFASNFLSYFPFNNQIIPCKSDEFKTLAARPKNSRFDLTKISSILSQPRSWKKAVEDYANFLKSD